MTDSWINSSLNINKRLGKNRESLIEKQADYSKKMNKTLNFDETVLSDLEPKQVHYIYERNISQTPNLEIRTTSVLSHTILDKKQSMTI
jgi:hypothetical protein